MKKRIFTDEKMVENKEKLLYFCFLHQRKDSTLNNRYHTDVVQNRFFDRRHSVDDQDAYRLPRLVLSIDVVLV